MKDIKEFKCNHKVEAIDSLLGLKLCTDPIHLNTLFEEINMDTITDVLSIDQIGNLDNGLYIRSNNITNIGSINDYQEKLNLNIVNDDILPITPISYINKYTNTNTYLLTGYNNVYSNKFYHSRLDNGTNINIDNILNVSQVLLKMIIKLSKVLESSYDIPKVNQTYAIELLECLSSNWKCNLFEKFISFEELGIQYSAGAKTAIDIFNNDNNNNNKKQLFPSYYTGTFRQNIIRKRSEYYGKYNDVFDKNHTHILMIPSPLEAFIRSSLSLYLGSNNNDNSTIKCQTKADCSTCTILSYTSVKMECISSRCVCPVAHYHIALDTSIVPDSNINFYTVVQNNNDDDDMIYTEPYWTDLSIKIITTTDPSLNTYMIIFAIGIIIIIT